MSDIATAQTMRGRVYEAIEAGRHWHQVPVIEANVDIWYHRLDEHITPRVVAVVWNDDGSPRQVCLDGSDVTDHYLEDGSPESFTYRMCFALDLQIAVEWQERCHA